MVPSCIGTILMMCLGEKESGETLSDDLQLRTDNQQAVFYQLSQTPLVNGCPMVCKPKDYKNTAEPLDLKSMQHLHIGML